MASEIRLQPEQLRDKAQQFDAQAEAVDGVIAAMTSLLGELQEEWHGAASEAYAEEFNELKPSFQKAEQLIEDIANQLRGAASTLEQTDADIASSFR